VETAKIVCMIDKIRPAVFVLGDDKKKGKERKGKVDKVTRRYISAICGVDTHGPIPLKFGVQVAPHDVIRISNFCNLKFSGVSDLRGVTQNSHFPIDFAGYRYNSL